MPDQTLRRARAGLTQVIEPADGLGVLASQIWGPNRLLEIIDGKTPSQQDWKALADHDAGDGQLTKTLRNHFGSAIERWRRRRKYLKPDQALHYIASIGGWFMTPEDERWPSALADLGVTEPLGLWGIGEGDVPPAKRMLSLVGSHEATIYGETATAMLAKKARQHGVTVLSGGAYGIDAEAHRAALSVPGHGIPTIAVLAGGLDQLYPAGNRDLLGRIATKGLLIAEMPPGMRPNRYRFLNRNRIIAALSFATIVVEARYRSGALNTAHHAHDLSRFVGAVPGPINVPNSAGCHRLMKETPTMLIDDPTDLEDLFGESFKPTDTAQSPEHQRAYDVLDVEEMLVFEALPVQSRTTSTHLCGITGLSVPTISGILTKLERHALAEHNAHGWRKHPDTNR